MSKPGLTRLLAAGCLVSLLGCSDAAPEPSSDRTSDPTRIPDPPMPTGATLAALVQASSCDDLLRKIQDDAVAKVKMAVELARKLGPEGGSFGGVLEGGSNDADFDEGATASIPPQSAPTRGATTSSKGESAPQDASSNAGAAPSPSVAPDAARVPTGASDTNRQVKEVDEADFVKVVQQGANMYLLHGNTLRRIKSFPPEQTALVGQSVTIEGTPSEMFVTDYGKAVVFSSVYGKGIGKPVAGGVAVDLPCPADGSCGGGVSALKITQLDVTGDTPRVERERYYEGSYISSRRYTREGSDVVRAVVQSSTGYQNLYTPEVDWYDAWNRQYPASVIDSQLAAWELRTSSAIRATKLEDWLPEAQERQNGALVKVAPQCASYFVPVAGLADYGLTQVLALDVTQPGAAATGVTIVGATSTVYSNLDRLVLAQPDYRWQSRVRDFGTIPEQRTALHQFELTGATTRYVASGWVPGHLPPHNPQFGIDVSADGTVRVATTGDVRDSSPTDKPSQEAFWRQHPETRVITTRATGNQLVEVGRTGNLGLPSERVQSARFVGDRAYVVTFLQTDPLVVVDVANPAAPTVLGQIKIPGFSQYMHPLDANHLITVGQSATRGIQLQLFDVTNPANIPAPKVHDFGSGSASEASYSHKAFTFYEGILALPVSGAYASNDYRYRYYTSALQLLRVDAQSGFQYLGAIDHAPLYADNGAGVKCGVCSPQGCYAYACGYAPEVRRGHFVKSDSKTYVYSFSHAGVLVNDLGNLAAPLARVGLPAPQYAYDGGYMTGAGRATTSVGAAPPDLATSTPASMPSGGGSVASPVAP